MKSSIENFLKEFVKKREDIFGVRSEFVNFECAEITTNVTKCQQSNTTFGCIRYRNGDGKILLSPPLVLKSPPTISIIAEVLLWQFANEIFVYGHVLPYFAHLDSSVLDLFPKFYASFTETYPGSSEAVILLENLAPSSYQNAPCRLFLDYAHLSLMVRSLGKFHAFSYLAKQLDPIHFQAHALSLNPTLGVVTGKFRGEYTFLGGRGLKHLSLQDDYKSFVPIIQNLLDNADEIFMTIFKNERNNPWAVICHGDYLAGNVMFKYDKGQPIELKMFDLATGALSSPALDLALVLYINANQETRDHHWDQLIDDYCDGLSSLPISIEKLPSRDVIIKEMQSKAFYAYLVASYFLPTLVAEKFKLGSFHQFLPPQYIDCQSIVDLPLDIGREVGSKIGGEVCTQYLSIILKDMLKRGFIQNSSQSTDC